MERHSKAAEEVLARIPSGTWTIDPMHSSVTFSVRHLMSKVRGRFSDVEGHIVVGPAPSSCSVEASIATASVDTGTQLRDDDLRSPTFFDSARFPAMRFASTQVTAEGDEGSFTLVGELTIRDVTRPVTLECEFLGLDESGLQGEPRIGISGRTTVRRSDFKVGASSVEGSKVVVGDSVLVELDIEAYLAQ
jgi:polyisoprenoid-binding protein YceI